MMTPLEAKKGKLEKIYEQFEIEVHEYKKNAICKPGCAFCCTEVGDVDITTLEGLIIRERVSHFPKSLKTRIRKKSNQNKAEKEKGNISSCPFLKGDNTCLIYDIRPFSCRQLYSIRECQEVGATIHRPVAERARATVREMQELDISGYSGHLSFILHLLGKPGFRKVYESGGFDPAKIIDFGKTHGIVINRYVCGLSMV